MFLFYKWTIKEIRELVIGLYVDTDSTDHEYRTESSVVSMVLGFMIMEYSPYRQRCWNTNERKVDELVV